MACIYQSQAMQLSWPAVGSSRMPRVLSVAPAPDLAVPSQDHLGLQEEAAAMAVTVAAITPIWAAALTTVRELCRPTSGAAAEQGRAATIAAVLAAAPSNCLCPDAWF